MHDFYLENVEEASLNSSDFFIPSFKERLSQDKGQIVRLHFILKESGDQLPRAERMWVEITSKENIYFTGVLTNQPKYLKTISIGDTISFEVKNIARTIIKKGHPEWVECSEKKALVSAMLFDEGETTRFMYRENAERKEDSGWRLFTGHENEEYTNNSKNIRICEVGWLLDKDPTLLLPFQKGKQGDVYERTTTQSQWEKVEDWSPIS